MLKLGVIGYGKRIGNLITHVIRAVMPETRVTAVIDPDEKGVRARLSAGDDAVFFGSLDELVRNAGVDGLLIGTRCDLHARYAAEAARYDIPLFLEKPVATSLEDLRMLANAFSGSRCKALVSFPLRVSPLCREAKSRIVNGDIGRPDHVSAVNHVPYGTCYFERGYRDYAVTRGLFLQKATHDLDYLMYLMGERIVRVAAMATRGKIFGGTKAADLTCSRCGDKDICLESGRNRMRNTSGGDTGDHLCPFSSAVGDPESGMNEESSSVIFEFESGAHGVYSQVFFTRREGMRGAVVSGYKGTLSFDWYRNDLQMVRHHEPFTDTVKAGNGLSHFGGDSVLADNFIAMMEGKKEPLVGISEGIASAAVCLAAKRSSERGEFVPVRYP